jgi:hypothetical protein
MIEKPYPPSPGFHHYQFARTAEHWRADIEARLVEHERPIDWAEPVIALMDFGYSIDGAIEALGHLYDCYAED